MRGIKSLKDVAERVRGYLRIGGFELAYSDGLASAARILPDGQVEVRFRQYVYIVGTGSTLEEALRDGAKRVRAYERRKW